MPLLSSLRSTTFWGVSRRTAIVVVPEVPALFLFTTHTFTTGSTVGRFGPSLGTLRSLYNGSGQTWAADSSYFFQGRAQGYQVWQVPVTGIYEIEIAGARGQASNSNIGYGLGAIVKAQISLSVTDRLEMVVGQVPGNGGSTNPSNSYAGSGGGSFVGLYGTNTPVIVAGGGAGLYNTWTSVQSIHNGQTRRQPRFTGYNYGQAVDGTDPAIGGGGRGYHGGGGGGWFTAGLDYTNFPGSAAMSTGSGGQNFTHGASFVGSSVSNGDGTWYATGGNATALTSEGGFGGGGGGHSGNNSSGGGGGYSGGLGGQTSAGGSYLSGIGGGSFIREGATAVATSNGQYDGNSTFGGSSVANIGSFNDGAGYIKITRIGGGGGGTPVATTVTVNGSAVVSGTYLFNNSNNVNTITVTGAAKAVTFSLWGAAGGNGAYPSSGSSGAGGFSKGTVILQPGTTYYLYVGQGGFGPASYSYGTGGAGGWPNGGYGTVGDASGAGGGGMTMLSTTTFNTSMSDASILLIAGGGGGSTGYAGAAGAGGGATGQSAAGGATGGTQSSGGTFNGTRLTGGPATGSQTGGSDDGGGGGGGYYGGGGGTSDARPGAGGSGYANSLLVSATSLITGSDTVAPNPDSILNANLYATGRADVTGSPANGRLGVAYITFSSDSTSGYIFSTNFSTYSANFVTTSNNIGLSSSFTSETINGSTYYGVTDAASNKWYILANWSFGGTPGRWGNVMNRDLNSINGVNIISRVNQQAATASLAAQVTPGVMYVDAVSFSNQSGLGFANWYTDTKSNQAYPNLNTAIANATPNQTFDSATGLDNTGGAVWFEPPLGTREVMIDFANSHSNGPCTISVVEKSTGTVKYVIRYAQFAGVATGSGAINDSASRTVIFRHTAGDVYFNTDHGGTIAGSHYYLFR